MFKLAIFLIISSTASIAEVNSLRTLEGYWVITQKSYPDLNTDRVFNVPTKFSILRTDEKQFSVTLVYGPDTVACDDVTLNFGSENLFYAYRRKHKYMLIVFRIISENEIVAVKGVDVMEPSKKPKLKPVIGNKGAAFERISAERF
jgi:hypothetical protein